MAHALGLNEEQRDRVREILAWIVAALALIALAVLLPQRLQPAASESRAYSFTIPQPGGAAGPPVISPDGRHLVYRSRGQLWLRALDEAFAVAAASGIQLDRDAVLRGLETITTPGGTGDNKSSLCEDVLNRRPTEVEFIYGSVIALGREHGVATPTLETLHAIVKGLESHYL